MTSDVTFHHQNFKIISFPDVPYDALYEFMNKTLGTFCQINHPYLSAYMARHTRRYPRMIQNGCNMTVYFILGRIDMGKLISVLRKIPEYRPGCNIGVQIKMHFDFCSENGIKVACLRRLITTYHYTLTVIQVNVHRLLLFIIIKRCL